MDFIVRGDDSPLGRWTYSQWRPAHLAGVVDLLWHFEGPTAHRRKRIFPNGRVELLVNLGEPYRIVGGAGAEVLGAAFLGGMQSGPALVDQPARQNVLGVRLYPAAAYALLAMPMYEVTGLTLDLGDLVGAAARELAGRCGEAVSVDQRFRLAADWVRGRIARSRGVDEAIAWSAARIDRTAGAVASAMSVIEALPA